MLHINPVSHGAPVISLISQILKIPKVVNCVIHFFKFCFRWNAEEGIKWNAANNFKRVNKDKSFPIKKIILSQILILSCVDHSSSPWHILMAAVACRAELPASDLPSQSWSWSYN